MKPFQEAAADNGLGLTPGAAFAAENRSPEVRIDDVGAIVWGQTQAGTFHVRGDSLTLADMIRGLRPAGADSGRPDPFSDQGASGPGVSFIPTVEAGLVQPWLHGKLPSRIGWSVGGPERFASALGLGFRLSRLSCAAEMEPFGTIYGVPRRGFRFGWSMQAGL